jgi:hypothetical protein
MVIHTAPASRPEGFSLSPAAGHGSRKQEFSHFWCLSFFDIIFFLQFASASFNIVALHRMKFNIPSGTQQKVSNTCKNPESHTAFGISVI